MNRQLVSIGLAAAVVWGVAVALVPQHAVTALRVVLVAAVLVVGTSVLAAIGAVTRHERRRTPLDAAASGPAPSLDPQGLRDARRDLGRPHAEGRLPIPVWNQLQAVAALRTGTSTRRGRAADRTPLSAESTALLRTRPPAGAARHPAAVATIVHDFLDDLERLP